MNDLDEDLTKVERRMLRELLAFRATLAAEPAADGARCSSSRPQRPKAAVWPHLGKLRLQLPRAETISVPLVLLALLAIVLVSLLSGSNTRALAATPKPLTYNSPGPGAPSGRQELLNLAAAAARQPIPSADHPLYAYTKTRGWYLDSRIDGKLTTSTVVPTTTESWAAPNGSGRIRTTMDKPGEAPTVVSDFNPGGHDPLLRLTTNKAALAHELAQGHPRSDGPVERFVALTDLANQQPIPGVVEAVILRLLSTTPDLVYRGTATDRAGRPGVAVSIDSTYSGLPERYTWIFSTHTGALLDEEGRLLGSAGKLNVRRGSVISYTIYLASGWVTSTSSWIAGQVR
jgi:hypothetical protein